jgi:hypothetical protein
MKSFKKIEIKELKLTIVERMSLLIMATGIFVMLDFKLGAMILLIFALLVAKKINRRM